ncbi:MAG: hypothetical protein ACFFDN_12985 [Candidatus Hodarchaeota archaeon]
MEEFKDLLEKVKNRNLRIDNPSSYQELNDYMNDMKKNKNSQVKNELAYYIEQARLEITSYYQALMLTEEKVEEIYTKVGIEDKRAFIVWDVISDISDKLITDSSKLIFEGAKEGNFEYKVKEAYEFAEKLLLYILELLKQFQKKQV